MCKYKSDIIVSCDIPTHHIYKAQRAKVHCIYILTLNHYHLCFSESSLLVPFSNSLIWIHYVIDDTMNSLSCLPPSFLESWVSTLASFPFRELGFNSCLLPFWKVGFQLLPPSLLESWVSTISTCYYWDLLFILCLHHHYYSLENWTSAS
jgi:hypothetical protein